MNDLKKGFLLVILAMSTAIFADSRYGNSSFASQRFLDNATQFQGDEGVSLQKASKSEAQEEYVPPVADVTQNTYERRVRTVSESSASGSSSKTSFRNLAKSIKGQGISDKSPQVKRKPVGLSFGAMASRLQSTSTDNVFQRKTSQPKVSSGNRRVQGPDKFN